MVSTDRHFGLERFSHALQLQLQLQLANASLHNTILNSVRKLLIPVPFHFELYKMNRRLY